jgi:hypothetical protein
LLGRKRKAVQAGLNFNPVEFDGIKTGIVEAFPNTKEFYGVPIPEQVPNYVVRVVRIFVFADGIVRS